MLAMMIAVAKEFSEISFLDSVGVMLPVLSSAAAFNFLL